MLVVMLLLLLILCFRFRYHKHTKASCKHFFQNSIITLIDWFEALRQIDLILGRYHILIICNKCVVLFPLYFFNIKNKYTILKKKQQIVWL